LRHWRQVWLDMIDSAILQRFTEHIEIKLPNEDERIQLLDSFIGKVPFENCLTVGARMDILVSWDFASYCRAVWPRT
jgi:AAA+ superfamily predicted ATPase